MREPQFELTVNPKRLAHWANVPLGLDASDHDLGKAYPHRRFPLLRQSQGDEPALYLMPQANGPASLKHERELPPLVSRDSLVKVTHLHRALQRRRCLVPADRILNLQHDGSEAAAKCSLALRSGRVFGLAAIWDENAAKSVSFSVIMTLVSPALHPFAQCMPVVIADKDRERWLNNTAADIPEDLLRPLSESELREWTLSPSFSA